jgi:hypothetical protein
MPSLNQTGPEGQGSMTGRKMGKCANKKAPIPNGTGNAGKGRGQGKGLGRGNGQGRRNNISEQ